LRVYAEGDFPVTEHLGHRQDFEDELGRRGFRHEEFTLHVQAAFRSGPKPTSIGAYAVRVTHVPTCRWTIYRCGPRDDWLAQFKEDLSMGVFGHLAALHAALAGVERT
jgi:hypothetical protein